MSVNTIDGKLHKIILNTNKSKYPNSASLSRFIANQRHDEFSYYRDGEKKHCKWHSISDYISFAQELGLLGSDCSPTAPEEDLQSLASFRNWSGDLLLRFSRARGFNNDKLVTAVIRLMKEKKQLPTTELLYAELNLTEVSEQVFRWALKLQSILRPATLGLCRRWLWIPDGIFEYKKST